MAAPPSQVLNAFRAVEALEGIAALLVDDGFDAEIMRVLSAWPNAELRWSSPASAVPDDGRPTSATWRWLVSGLDMAAAEKSIAAIAGISKETARIKVAVLIGHRLVYPDGGMTKSATSALRAHVARALGLKEKKPKPEPESTSPAKVN